MIVSQVNWVYKKDRKTTHVSYRYSIRIHSLLLKMKARQIHIMSQNNDRIVSDLLFYCHLGTCQNQLCATPALRKKKKINLCRVCRRFFNNGGFQITQSDRIQVNLNEIDLLFPQISQNMMADCLSDFPSFYTNLHILFCQFIN